MLSVRRTDYSITGLIHSQRDGAKHWFNTSVLVAPAVSNTADDLPSHSSHTQTVRPTQ
jgi:hypothetical protein